MTIRQPRGCRGATVRAPYKCEFQCYTEMYVAAVALRTEAVGERPPADDAALQLADIAGANAGTNVF